MLSHKTMCLVSSPFVSCVAMSTHMPADMFVVQILEDEPFEVMKPIVEGLLEDVDQNKQRAAAEMMAGVLGGMKHWPQTKQEHIWKWCMPHLEKALGSNLKPDTSQLHGMSNPPHSSIVHANITVQQIQKAYKSNFTAAPTPKPTPSHKP